MTQALFKIGEVARLTHCTTRALRLYERRRMIRSCGRTAGGMRLFTQDTVPVVHTIRALQSTGFTLGDIAAALTHTDACGKVRLLIERKRSHFQQIHQEVQQKLTGLDALLSCCPREREREPCTAMAKPTLGVAVFTAMRLERWAAPHLVAPGQAHAESGSRDLPPAHSSPATVPGRCAIVGVRRCGH